MSPDTDTPRPSRTVGEPVYELSWAAGDWRCNLGPLGENRHRLPFRCSKPTRRLNHRHLSVDIRCPDRCLFAAQFELLGAQRSASGGPAYAEGLSSVS